MKICIVGMVTLDCRSRSNSPGLTQPWLGLDIDDEAKARQINEGRSYIKHISAEVLRQANSGRRTFSRFDARPPT
jgi:hypothetical protein